MSLDQILADLRKEYLSELPNRIETIRRHLEQGDAAILREDFHKLKGTGKTYGIPELSVVAELGEIICRDRQPRIAKAVPLALDLMVAIHSRRVQQQTFDLNADPRFSELHSLK